ncbi:MAG: hypothetical protein H6691_09910 [Gemmatimonadales bacterium]|nr:hypothetical protein [Gemmatimonadales bacterium]
MVVLGAWLLQADLIRPSDDQTEVRELSSREPGGGPRHAVYAEELDVILRGSDDGRDLPPRRFRPIGLLRCSLSRTAPRVADCWIFTPEAMSRWLR